MYIDTISKELATILAISHETLSKLLTKPKEKTFGDIALPVFTLSSGKNPVEFAKEVASRITSIPQIQKAQAIGPYVNLFLQSEFLAQNVIRDIVVQKDTFGSMNDSNPKTYVIDYSAPNIAKPFGIGHLRSTVIGNSLKNMLTFLGQKVVGINYIGDWGTQFGKVICAYKKWGSQEKLQVDPIAHLLDLYVQFHEKAQTDESLVEEAREIFSQLEAGNEEYMQLWKEFRKLSLDKFDQTYKMLQVSFDEVRGEAYYNDKMDTIVSQLREKQLLKESDGAHIIDFADFNIKLPPIIILKSNGASTYALRDITAAIDRVESFGADFLLYEVGAEQKLHFQQVIATLKLLGHEWAENMIHVDHGFYRFGDEKFSTRKGNIVLMEDVLHQSIDRVKKIIQEKNPELAHSPEFETVAKEIGVGAVMFFDMKNDRVKDVAFTWDAVLDFQGESGPYIQYTHARISSVLDKQNANTDTIDYTQYQTVEEKYLLLALADFQIAIQQSVQNYKPHVLARYILELAQTYNDFYQKHKVLGNEEALTNARLVLCSCVAQVLRNGLGLLGIRTPRRM